MTLWLVAILRNESRIRAPSQAEGRLPLFALFPATLTRKNGGNAESNAKIELADTLAKTSNCSKKISSKTYLLASFSFRATAW